MLKKLASSLLVSFAFAGDFLARVTNSALSDNSVRGILKRVCNYP